MRHGAFVAMLIPIFVIFGAAMPISDSSIEGLYLPGIVSSSQAYLPSIESCIHWRLERVRLEQD
jgi:hypothetical protein